MLFSAPDPPDALCGDGLCCDCAVMTGYHKLRLGQSLLTLHDPPLEMQDPVFDGPVKGDVEVCGNEDLPFFEDGHCCEPQHLVRQGGEEAAEQSVLVLKQGGGYLPLAPDPPRLPSLHARGAEGTDIRRWLRRAVDDAIEEIAPVTHGSGYNKDYHHITTSGPFIVNIYDKF